MTVEKNSLTPVSSSESNTVARQKISPVNIENPVENQPRALSVNVYPNPSNERFNFNINNGGRQFRLTIYDVTGRIVTTIRTDNPGISWDCRNSIGKSLGTGVYFARFDCDSNFVTKKLLYLK